jgi:trans-2,3-dihydro-3-hydroxyanthranilate isomerase
LDQESIAHARFFAPHPDLQEDAASGLPAGALGAYFVENEFIQRDRYDSIIIEQGHWMGRPSKIFVKVEKRGPAIHKVEVGGSAIVSFKGRLTVP